ncbi:sensor histidine kinase [Nocardiopsis ansamitocini]|uniref:histidine kinase n=1 Tax=Nocardiopsis ansamitocini TaxID=1670832 RepID=A0A9W6P3C1_9ACTN|nr:sensor domain-containing protein [Nocardiopsis ansamitocini]GLU46470.1 histidine kinase [Nocardiopsis ansamitocini]
MTDIPAEQPLQAMRRRRYLVSAWPWRSAAHVVTTLIVTGVVLLLLAALAVPATLAISVLVDPLRALGPGEVLLLPVGIALFVLLAPAVTIPLGALERLRLRLVDDRPVRSGHRIPATPGLWPWLRTRYTEAATWYEFAYAGVLILVMLPLIGLLGMLLFMCGLVVFSPIFLFEQDDVPFSLGFTELTEPLQALPWSIGVVALLLCGGPYLLGLLTSGHALGARVLLGRESTDELRDELGQVTDSRARLVDAFEIERRRIERDLHDGAQQRLVALTMQLGMARLDVPAESPAAASVEQAHEQAKLLLAELRELIRGIHPQVLTDRGLAAALPELADRVALPVRVSVDIAERPPAHVESTAYFVVAEALTNLVKHSEATTAAVTAALHDGALVVEVHDDGQGGAEPGKGSGLTGLVDRVSVMDGTMTLSSPSGGPTLIRVELPCPK